MVLCILVEMQIPLRILPLIETLLVKGHFLSTQVDSMASLGVLNPSPMFLKYLTPDVVFLANSFLVFKNTASCFWNDLSCQNQNERLLDYQPYFTKIFYKNIIIVDLFIAVFLIRTDFFTFQITQMVRIIENYTLYEIIGEGAYGKVYRATNKLDTKQYAVKVIEVRRFKENKKLEQCTVNQINILTNIEKHEHIIKYIDMLKTPNNFYFVYEYCNGGTLEGVLKKQRVLPQKKALLIFKQLLEAFQVLNKYNIMHRDLKPDNIFFSNGVVKLGDFGFCKSLEKANMTKTMLGSPIYMAPQILRGQIYSTKADIWSLGVVLYEMLYGFCPFESTTIPKLLEVLKQTELEFPSTEPVSQELKKLLKKLLTKDPTKRIEWMDLLKTQISNEGKLIAQKQRMSLVDDDSGLFESQKMVSSVKDLGQKKGPQENGPQYQSVDNLNYTNSPGVQSSNEGMSFLKKKNTAESGKRNSTYGQEKEAPIYQSQNLKKKILKQHAQCNRGILLAVQIIKSNDSSAVLFAYLLLKKVQQKLIQLRDEVANFPEFKDVTMSFNMQLKEISLELSKYNLNESLTNWKALIKSTGEFHRNFRSFYMMVAFLAGEVPKEDLTHVEMQMDIRAKIN